MNLPTLAFRNTRRNRTRTFLTILGVTVAVVAFGFLRTCISAYYTGAEVAAKDRLVTRNLINITFPLPVSYKAKVEHVPGVKRVSMANWFGGIYQTEKNFFAQFAVEPEPFLDLYPELLLEPAEKQAWIADRTGCIIGDKLARKYGWHVGSIIPLRGTIYRGDWHFTVRGIYRPREHGTDATQMFFHWKYLDESMPPERRAHTGLFFVGIDDPARSPEIAKAIDAEFKGASFETRTETEKQFQMSFISMVSAVITALQIVSGFVLVIVALILGNTIAMSVRERGSEVAVLKALGFAGGKLALLITLEAALLGLLGGAAGVAVAYPLVTGFGKFLDENMGSFFPVFQLTPVTLGAMLGLSVLVGLVAALVPAIRVARTPVATAFRQIG
jgi:putative ABC transport system permease protein